MKLLIIDTETTGLDPEVHEIIEFGAIVIIDGVIVEKIECKIQPKSLDRADRKAMDINGYSEYKWRTAISQESAARLIWAFLARNRDAISVGHNLHFDRKFLEAFGRESGIEIKLSSPYLDTRDICRATLAPYGLESMRLDDICKFLGWTRRNAHSALSDCEDCARIIANMVPPSKKFMLRLEIQKQIRRIKSVLK